MQSSVCQGQPSPLLLHAEHCVDSEDKQRFKEVYGHTSRAGDTGQKPRQSEVIRTVIIKTSEGQGLINCLLNGTDRTPFILCLPAFAQIVPAYFVHVL